MTESPNQNPYSPSDESNQDADQGTNGEGNAWVADIRSGVVVFLVALPLCLGIALASEAPLMSGLLAGIVGGVIVGALSGSHTSVSGPAAGLTAVVIVQIDNLGFETFLLAVFLGGIIQIALGLAKAGALSAFFPSSVIKGLLAAIGVILILKQIPHLLGHDTDPEGEMAFEQPDKENTFSEIWNMLANGEVHTSAIIIGFLSIGLLVLWGKWKPLKNSIVPGPLVVVLLGVGMNLLFGKWGEAWVLGGSHLVQIPVADTLGDLLGSLQMANFSLESFANPAVYVGAATLAIVASLETLLNLQAVDKLDKFQRTSPANRELLAQGVGNVVGGLIGALPVTSVIVRSSVNVNSGGRTKRAAVIHGFFLIASVALLPKYMNMIPLSALAAILLVTGFKLASPKLFRDMLREGRYQFVPFIVTLVSIVMTDLLIGILIGLAVSVVFILNSNLRRPIRRVVETQFGEETIHVELANQVSFLHKAALSKLFNEVQPGSHLLIDATDSNYIDPDIQSLIRDYKEKTAPARNIVCSLKGFREKYRMPDDHAASLLTTEEFQGRVSPAQTIEILKEGNRRFQTGNRLTRDYGRQIGLTVQGQNPLACVLSCIDSRVPTEIVFDMGIGDIFSVRVAGNALGEEALGSLEYGVGVAGVKLVVVLGHTRSGVITSSVDLAKDGQTSLDTGDFENLQPIVNQIADCMEPSEFQQIESFDDAQRESYIDEIGRRNVLRTVETIREKSPTIRNAESEGRIMLVGATYDIRNGQIEFLSDEA